MGIVIALVMGVLLTMPTSSAAIWVALATPVLSAGGQNAEAMLLAGGAAVVGCACHMMGFAMMSYKENGISGFIAQGIGTSMLQIPNIMKNGKLLLPPMISSAILGPIATCIFKLQMNGSPVSSGMGTCGFVGQIGVYTGWLNDVAAGTKDAITGMDWIGMLLVCFVLPAILSWVFCEILRKMGWIKEGDLKLDL